MNNKNIDSYNNLSHAHGSYTLYDGKAKNNYKNNNYYSAVSKLKKKHAQSKDENLYIPDDKGLRNDLYETKTIIDEYGNTYKGELKNGVPNGYGVLHTKNGSVYEGEFMDDMIHGKGKFTLKDGSYYIGELKHDICDGYGEWHLKSGLVYKGEFKDDLANGQGVLIKKDKTKYEGEFKNNKPNGYGKYTYPDGSVYTGEVKDGKRSGKGTITDFDGQVKVGQWDDDKYRGTRFMIILKALLLILGWVFLGIVLSFADSFLTGVYMIITIFVILAALAPTSKSDGKHDGGIEDIGAGAMEEP